METKQVIIETLGSLAKEESLITLDNHILPNTLVLESLEPYPGYHGPDLPAEFKPLSVFLITGKKYSTEKIFRIANNIKKNYSYPFDAVPGKICIQNLTIPCIRIREIDNYELIGELQKQFVSEGISFAKKRNLKGEAIIRLRKHFKIQRIDDGIYKDLDDPASSYIRIDFQLNWKMFTKITRTIKNNVDNSNFDAAIAAIYTKDIIDAVRIYSRNISIGNLKKLREKYILEIQRMP